MQKIFFIIEAVQKSSSAQLCWNIMHWTSSLALISFHELPYFDKSTPLFCGNIFPQFTP